MQKYWFEPITDSSLPLKQGVNMMKIDLVQNKLLNLTECSHGCHHQLFHLFTSFPLDYLQILRKQRLLYGPVLLLFFQLINSLMTNICLRVPNIVKETNSPLLFILEVLSEVSQCLPLSARASNSLSYTISVPGFGWLDQFTPNSCIY